MNLNELKCKYEETGDWNDALVKIKEATGDKDIAAAMKEGWKIEDFAKLLLGDDAGGTQGEESSPEQPPPQVDYSFAEAPASFNVKAISPQGFDVMLTLRDADTKALMDRAQHALKWLAEKGFSPTPQRYGGNASSQQTGGNGGEPDSKVCPVHHVAMRKREKHGETWWSHKAINPETNEEYWCKGGAK